MTDKNIVWRDNYNPENDNEENKSESFENIAYENAIEENRLKHARFVKIAVAAFSVLVIILAILIFKSRNYIEENQLATIEKRMDRLESEFISLKVYIASKLDEAIKEMERDRNTPASQFSSSEKTTPPEKKEPEEVKTKIHKVQTGESLSRISRYHGLTVQQLREYNNLGPDSIIHPGDELKLTP